MSTVAHLQHTRQYDKLLRQILLEGDRIADRTGEESIKLFGHSLSFDVRETIPILTGKKIASLYTYLELLWFISGSTLLSDLDPRVHHWWDRWIKDPTTSSLGPIYGKQLRDHGAGHVDQLAQVVESIKTSPMSRRHIVTTWDPTSVPDMGLPPCHGLVIQFDVSSDGYLSLCMTQRSADAFVGLPINMLSYTMLLYMVAQVTGLKPGRLTMFLGNVHIYVPHLSAVREYLDRRPAEQSPVLALNENVKDLFEFGVDDVKVKFYYPEGPISAGLFG